MTAARAEVSHEHEGAAALGPDRVSRRWLAFWAAAVTATYALLWTPWWYPLSDSSLYLSLARSLAGGRGFTYMGVPHRLVPMGTPMLFAGLMKLGGGVGTLQAVCTALMLAAHYLSFRVLRRWVGERLALPAVLAACFSYWVFANAFTLMSEPFCLTLLWGGLLCLTNAAEPGAGPGRRWLHVVGGCVLLLGAVDNRIAAVFLVPGAVAALLVYTRRSTPRRTRLAWAALFVIAFGTFGANHFFSPKIARLYARLAHPAATQAATQAAAQPGDKGGLLAAVSGDEEANDSNDQYKHRFLPGVGRNPKGLLIDLPALAGRWVCEGLAMPTYALFASPNPALRATGAALAWVTFLVACVGGWATLRRRNWWIAGLMLYFFVFWIEWGVRIKPRYMAPIAPLLFILLLTGVLEILARLKPPRPAESSVPPVPASPRLFLLPPSPSTLPVPASVSSLPRARGVMAFLLAGVVVANAPAWAVEFYVRHVTGRPFYEAARRGALSDLVDISAYLRDRTAPGEAIGLNAGAHRRIVYFLTGRKVDLREHAIHSLREGWADAAWDEKSKPPPGPRIRLRQYLDALPPTVRYAIVFVDKDPPWPEWHLPPRRAPSNGPAETWWRLYVRQAPGPSPHPGSTFVPFVPPHVSGEAIRHIPASGV